ncbi:purine-binding chemotaxis protein CheW [Carnobacterium iners]|uniref:Purine-binding chemotaxis protein CheW n=1 Tax=Carnobacterium iners TaxID=1073423 RepID=A0A1X7MZX5_9LACT|nr:chemotaxis protein CheW [Carnobacterium iners]SEK21269.1 purine-binding chemotaxis protein CheW [Carnobacterium iners]SMH30492.1 purine-binding chemotaxis protein CheW [Carnobacterium iners]
MTQIIVFTLNNKYYAFLSEEVEEILKKMPWTAIPQSPEWVQGLINLRGNVITLINFYKLLSPSVETKELCYNNIVIVKNKDEKLAFMVDNVEWVTEIDPADIQHMANKTNDHISGLIQIKDQLVNMINMETLFYKNEG